VCGALVEEVSVVAEAEVSHTIPFQRVQAFVGLAERRGWDLEALLSAAGIPATLLGEHRARLTGGQVTALLGALSRATGDELLGLGLAPVPPGTLRMLLSAIMFGTNDLSMAIRRLNQFENAVPGVPRLRLSVEGATAAVDVDITDKVHPLDFAVEALLATLHRTLGWLVGRRIELAEVRLPHHDRRHGNDYGVIFGAPVVFAAASPALVFPADTVSTKLLRRPEELEQFWRHAPAILLARSHYGSSTSDAVRRILDEGDCGMRLGADQVAARLTMSPQTMRRRLRTENTSLSEIRDALLRDVSIASLVQGEETMAALSRRLGFSEPSAFTRAFSRWTGQPPRAYRVKDTPNLL
jgi:AraC-like DNA-binding protein